MELFFGLFSGNSQGLTLEMQPIPFDKKPTSSLSKLDDNIEKHIETDIETDKISEVSEDVSIKHDEPTIETINKNEEISTP